MLELKMKISARVQITLFVVWISEIQKQSFADIFRNVHRKTSVLESFCSKYGELKACNFIKKRLQHRCFPVKFAKFLRTPFLQNISGGCSWKYLMNSLFVAFENNEWCHFVVRIGSPAFISFYCVCFVSFYFFLFFLFFFSYASALFSN